MCEGFVLLPVALTTEGVSVVGLFPFVALPSLPDVATEAVVLAPSGPLGEEQDGNLPVDLGEFSISRVINRQFSGKAVVCV